MHAMVVIVPSANMLKLFVLLNPMINLQKRIAERKNMSATNLAQEGKMCMYCLCFQLFITAFIFFAYFYRASAASYYLILMTLHQMNSDKMTVLQ